MVVLLKNMKGKNKMVTPENTGTMTTATEGMTGSDGSEGMKGSDGVDGVADAAESMEEVMEMAQPTFAEMLQGAISGFTNAVGELKASDMSVDNAEDSVNALQNQLTGAQATKRMAMENRVVVENRALDARDNLVGVLNSWTP